MDTYVHPKPVTLDDLINELVRHARTQTRYRGPGKLVSWHCSCGDSGESEEGRYAAIQAHKEHVRRVLQDVKVLA